MEEEKSISPSLTGDDTVQASARGSSPSEIRMLPTELAGTEMAMNVIDPSAPPQSAFGSIEGALANDNPSQSGLTVGGSTLLPSYRSR